MNDESIMPFGEYKGVLMKDVPEKWLRWFWGENVHDWKNGNRKKLRRDAYMVMAYIEDSFENLT